MPLLDQRSGCKVGWETWSTKAEAVAAAKQADADGARMLLQGYDFGYQVPGSILYVPHHSEHGECWVVTTP